jgi:TonB family protein
MKSEIPTPRLFSTLPDRPKPWKEFAFGMGTQSGIIAVLVASALLHPKVLVSGNHDYHFTRLVDTPVAVDHEPAPRRVLPLPMPPESSLKAPSSDAIRLPRQTKTVLPQADMLVAPQVEMASKVVPLPPVAPVIPKQLIKTNVFSTGSSQTQTIAGAPQKVQTGGFGDPNGSAAKANSSQPVTIARMGAFDLPAGSGNGNGTGENQGARGVIASAGFGGGVATGNQTPNTRERVHQAGFGDAELNAVAQNKVKQTEVAPTSPPEIVSKPTPTYTDEARKLHVEGEVLLEVLFESSGKLEVVRVVRGLGHGLDEAAIRAAEQIRFKPALRNGQPSDSRGVLHIMFQLT